MVGNFRHRLVRSICYLECAAKERFAHVPNTVQTGGNEAPVC